MTDKTAKTRKKGQQHGSAGRPTVAQRRYLALGLDQPGGKLPLFGPDGKKVDARTIQACLEKGWCEQWYRNPIKPDWLVCRLTEAGRRTLKDT